MDYLNIFKLIGVFIISIIFVLWFILFPSISNAETCPNDPSANSCWIEKAPMSIARESFGLVTNENRKLYAIGGIINNKKIRTSSVGEYNTES